MWLFRKAILAEGVAYPQFGKEYLHVLAALAHKSGRYDSHNYSKPIGDWLQAMGVTDDDTYAEIMCIKKTDYPKLFPDQTTTTLVVQRRSNLATISEAYYGAVLCSGTSGKRS